MVARSATTCRACSCWFSAPAPRSAGLAGVIGGLALVTQPTIAAALGPILFVVIVVGGLGSLAGAFIASLLIGILQTFAVAMNCSLAEIFGSPAPPLLGDPWQVTVAQLAPIIPYLLLVLDAHRAADGPYGHARVMSGSRCAPLLAVAGAGRAVRRGAARLRFGLALTMMSVMGTMIISPCRSTCCSDRPACCRSAMPSISALAASSPST